MNNIKDINKKIIIRVKKKILKETKMSDKKYITTYNDIKKYFRYFNKVLFKDKLNSFNDIKIKRLIKASGQCVENIDYYKGTSFFVLEMMPKYKNKLEFLILFHMKWFIFGNKLLLRILEVIISFFLVLSLNLKS